jgi:glycosyltransferase involved in cell wall biosynthesis
MADSPGTKVTLSVVVPMHDELPNVAAFFARTVPVLEALKTPWEIVCVDDGSRDETFTALLAEHRRDPRVKLLRLSRNFGKEAALTAGLAHARGDAVVPIDADLQDPPELIPELVAKVRADTAILRETAAAVPAGRWRERPSEGDWSAAEVCAHILEMNERSGSAIEAIPSSSSRPPIHS